MTPQTYCKTEGETNSQETTTVLKTTLVALSFERDGVGSILPTVATHLLRVVLLVREMRRHVEHDLDAAPVGVHRVQPRQVVHCVQPTLVLVETCSICIYIVTAFRSLWSSNQLSEHDLWLSRPLVRSLVKVTLMMLAVSNPETPVNFCGTTRRCFPDDTHTQLFSCMQRPFLRSW
jgi:hypothetical protein